MTLRRTKSRVWGAAVLLSLLLLISGCTPQSGAPVAQSTAEVASIEKEAQMAAPSPVATLPPPPSPTPVPVTPTVVADPTAAEPTAVVEEPTAEPTEPVEEESAAEAAIFGRTDDGAFFRGREDAPVTIIEYSDFL